MREHTPLCPFCHSWPTASRAWGAEVGQCGQLPCPLKPPYYQAYKMHYLVAPLARCHQQRPSRSRACLTIRSTRSQAFKRPFGRLCQSADSQGWAQWAASLPARVTALQAAVTYCKCLLLASEQYKKRDGLRRDAGGDYYIVFTWRPSRQHRLQARTEGIMHCGVRQQRTSQSAVKAQPPWAC